MVAPTLTSVSISSDNSNPALAGITDNVKLLFTADQEIITPTVTIDGKTVDSITNVQDNQWLAIKSMQKGDTEGVVPFTIDYSNLASEVGVQVTTTTDGSTVTFNESTITISKYADIAKVYKDIGKSFGNFNRDNLVTRSNEDASSKLQAIFLNLVVFDDLGTDVELAWFTDLATKLTTATFWKKSNGSDEQHQAVKDIIAEAEEIRNERFFPQEYR